MGGMGRPTWQLGRSTWQLGSSTWQAAPADRFPLASKQSQLPRGGGCRLPTLWLEHASPALSFISTFYIVQHSQVTLPFSICIAHSAQPGGGRGSPETDWCMLCTLPILLPCCPTGVPQGASAPALEVLMLLPCIFCECLPTFH